MKPIKVFLDLSDCSVYFASDLLRLQIGSLNLDDKRVTSNIAPRWRKRMRRRFCLEHFRFTRKRNCHFDKRTGNVEWMASICDVAHPILADVNLGLLQIHNNLVLMQLWYIDPVVVFEKVTKIAYRRIEKPISVDGVYFGLQCLPPILFYREPVSITEQGIVPPPTHGNTHAARSFQTTTNWSADRARDTIPCRSPKARTITTPATPSAAHQAYPNKTEY